MEHSFEEFPTCFSLSEAASEPDLVSVGFVDGSVEIISCIPSSNTFNVLWKKQMKKSVRCTLFARDNSAVYSMSQNKSMCAYDVETGKRARVIRAAHDDKPMCMINLPEGTCKGQQFATADESGQVRTWDFRADVAVVSSVDDQSESVNAMAADHPLLLTASSDGTLAAYDIRKPKLKLCSELMHSELLSVVVSDKFTYVGAGDGFIEVFKRGDYGNLLVRMRSGYTKGVTSMVQLRRGLMLAASEESNEIRLLHTEPNKQLGVVMEHSHEGVDGMRLSSDGQFAVTLSSFGQSIKFFPLQEILDKAPVINESDMPKAKREEKKGKKKDLRENFFDDLVEAKKASDEESEQSEHSDSEEEESGEGQGYTCLLMTESAC